MLFITAAGTSLASAQSVLVSDTGSGVAQTAATNSTAPQLTVTGAGFNGAMTVAQYQNDPQVGFQTSGSFFDLHVSGSDLNAQGSVQATFTNLAPGAFVYWWNGTAWAKVADAAGQPVVADTAGTATVTFTDTSSPTISQLDGTELFAGTFTPTLTAAAGTTVIVGTRAPLTASATLQGGNLETGGITFNLYGPDGTQVDSESTSVDGNGEYSTPTGFIPTVPGTYQWVAVYSGDLANQTVSSVLGDTPEIAVGAGAMQVGGTLYLVGGDTNDWVFINPVGASESGSSGVRVNAWLNGDGLRQTFGATTPISSIVISGFGGNDNILLDPRLTISATVVEGDGNDHLVLGGGDNVVTVGGGNDLILAGDGDNQITAGNGNLSVFAGNGSNTVVAGNGHDEVRAGDGDNLIKVGIGGGSIHVGDGDNVVLGGVNNAGNFTRYTLRISAGDGDNLIAGGLGHVHVRAGNGDNILIDGNVAPASPNSDTLAKVLGDWESDIQADHDDATALAADVVAIQARLLITYNSTNANRLEAGKGLDAFFATYDHDALNDKPGDVLNGNIVPAPTPPGPPQRHHGHGWFSW